MAFCAASVAVYMVNDVADTDRDRRHPVKRTRPVAAGILPKSQALAIAAVCAVAALAAGLAISVPLLSAILAGYLLSSLLYSLVLKHLPVIELVFVASGFVLRALGGAAATHVPPLAGSCWSAALAPSWWPRPSGTPRWSYSARTQSGTGRRRGGTGPVPCG